MERAVADALRRADHEDRRAGLVAELEAAGTRVVEPEGHRPKGYVRLSDIGLDDAAHQGETCHAAVVEMGYAGPVAIAVCTDRRRHSPKSPAADRSDLQVETGPTDPERERARERRRLAERRRDFVTSRLGSRFSKSAATDLLVGALLDRANTNDAGKAGALLGATAKPGRYGDDWHGTLADLAAKGEADRLRVGVAVAAAMAEARIAAGGHGDGAARYVEFLRTLGYEPEPDEARAAERNPTPDAPSGD